jgi:hypothetical protein
MIFWDLMLVGVMQSLGRFLTLAIALLVFASAAGANPNASMSLHTPDGDVQQVNIDEIWRVRESSGGDEPPGTQVIDYAFERLYVTDSLDSIINSIRSQRRIEKFTSPSGAPIYIVAEKVIGIARALPYQHHQNSKSLIIAREGQQQVREARDAVREALGK